jgi:hypothetical protein
LLHHSPVETAASLLVSEALMLIALLARHYQLHVTDTLEPWALVPVPRPSQGLRGTRLVPLA